MPQRSIKGTKCFGKVFVLFVLLCGTSPFYAQEKRQEKPVLYVVGTSHLDSQWNWTVQDSIRSFVPATFLENFKRFEKYPNYTFAYEGAIHYMWFKEYFPEYLAHCAEICAGRSLASSRKLDQRSRCERTIA